jgi:hypothetical protein
MVLLLLLHHTGDIKKLLRLCAAVVDALLGWDRSCPFCAGTLLLLLLLPLLL